MLSSALVFLLRIPWSINHLHPPCRSSFLSAPCLACYYGNFWPLSLTIWPLLLKSGLLSLWILMSSSSDPLSFCLSWPTRAEPHLHCSVMPVLLLLEPCPPMEKSFAQFSRLMQYTWAWLLLSASLFLPLTFARATHHVCFSLHWPSLTLGL